MEFRYVASDISGNSVRGVESADSMAMLIGRLKDKGLMPLRISEIKSTPAYKKIRFMARVKKKELAVFTRQLASVLNSGILLTEALQTISEDMENAYFSKVISNVISSVVAGDTFSGALSRYPDVFPTVYIALVRSGEEVGNLSNAMAGLAKYLEDYENIREKIVSATRYPLLVVFFMFVIVSIMVFGVIPKFNALFLNAGAQLPLLTRIVVGTSTFLITHTLLAIGIIVIFGLLIWCSLKIFRVRFAWGYFQLKLPLFGKMIRRVVLSRFCRTFSILLTGGISLVSSMKVANEATNNIYLKEVFDELGEDVTSGSSLSEAMRPHTDIPRILVKMVSIGERSGKLPDMLKRTSDYYDQELESALNKLSALIEPVLIIAIGSVVLVIALALYLPIFNMSTVVR